MKLIIALILMLAASGAIAQAKKKTPDEARFEQCRAKLKKAQQLDALYDLDWKSGRAEPRVVIGPTFISMPIDAKEGLVKTVNCFLMVGQQEKCIGFDVLHWQTGRRVGRFDYCRYRHD